MSEDRCVCCGEIVPEGRMVCPNCEKPKKPRKCNHPDEAPACAFHYNGICTREHNYECPALAENQRRKKMPRYIDADAVLQVMWNNLYQLEEEMEKKHGLDPIERLNMQNGFEAALQAVVTFPSSDVVKVTRCKDCKWYNKTKRVCEHPEWTDMGGWHKATDAQDYCFRAE